MSGSKLHCCSGGRDSSSGPTKDGPRKELRLHPDRLLTSSRIPAAANTRGTPQPGALEVDDIEGIQSLTFVAALVLSIAT